MDLKWCSICLVLFLYTDHLTNARHLATEPDMKKLSNTNSNANVSKHEDTQNVSKTLVNAKSPLIFIFTLTTRDDNTPIERLDEKGESTSGDGPLNTTNQQQPSRIKRSKPKKYENNLVKRSSYASTEYHVMLDASSSHENITYGGENEEDANELNVRAAMNKIQITVPSYTDRRQPFINPPQVILTKESDATKLRNLVIELIIDMPQKSNDHIPCKTRPRYREKSIENEGTRNRADIYMTDSSMDSSPDDFADIQNDNLVYIQKEDTGEGNSANFNALNINGTENSLSDNNPTTNTDTSTTASTYDVEHSTETTTSLNFNEKSTDEGYGRSTEISDVITTTIINEPNTPHTSTEDGVSATTNPTGFTLQDTTTVTSTVDTGDIFDDVENENVLSSKISDTGEGNEATFTLPAQNNGTGGTQPDTQGNVVASNMVNDGGGNETVANVSEHEIGTVQQGDVLDRKIDSTGEDDNKVLVQNIETGRHRDVIDIKIVNTGEENKPGFNVPGSTIQVDEAISNTQEGVIVANLNITTGINLTSKTHYNESENVDRISCEEKIRKMIIDKFNSGELICKHHHHNLSSTNSDDLISVIAKIIGDIKKKDFNLNVSGGGIVTSKGCVDHRKAFDVIKKVVSLLKDFTSEINLCQSEKK